MNLRSLLVISILSLLVGCKSKGDKYIIIINNVEGLETGSEVVNNGLTVGRVREMKLYNDSVMVYVELNKNYRVPAGSKFIVQSSLFGPGKLLIESSGNSASMSTKDTARGFRDTSKHFSFSSDTAKEQRMRNAAHKIAEGFKEFVEAARDTSDHQSKLSQ